MINSARVRERLNAVNLSQSEVARRLGVTQGAIAKVANNNPNGSSFLYPLSRVLRTTPEYLTNQTDDPDADARIAPLLSSDARDLLDCYLALPPADRAALLRVARTMNGIITPAPPALHDRRTEFQGEDYDQ